MLLLVPHVLGGGGLRKEGQDCGVIACISEFVQKLVLRIITIHEERRSGFQAFCYPVLQSHSSPSKQK